MIAQVSEFFKAALDEVYQGMYWAFHAVRCLLQARPPARLRTLSLW